MNCTENFIERKLEEFRQRSTVSPQAETGYRRIQNDVLRALIRTNLTGVEMRFVLSLIDLSWGHNRKTAIFSMSQITSEMQCSKSAAKRAAIELENRNIIVSAKTEVTAGQGRPIKEYAFNKYFDLWLSKGSQPEPFSQNLKGHGMNPLQILKGSEMNAKGSQPEPFREVTPFIRRKKERIIEAGQIGKGHGMNPLDEFTLANLLFEKTRSKDPGFKKPNMSVEAGIIKNIVYIDQRSPEEIEAVINFADTDSYFTHSVLTASDLKRDFSKIWVKMTAGNAKAHENPALPQPRTYAQCQDFERRQQHEMLRQMKQKRIEREKSENEKNNR